MQKAHGARWRTAFVSQRTKTSPQSAVRRCKRPVQVRRSEELQRCRQTDAKEPRFAAGMGVSVPVSVILSNARPAPLFLIRGTVAALAFQALPDRRRPAHGAEPALPRADQLQPRCGHLPLYINNSAHPAALDRTSSQCCPESRASRGQGSRILRPSRGASLTLGA